MPDQPARSTPQRAVRGDSRASPSERLSRSAHRMRTMPSVPASVLRLLVQCPDRPGIVAAVSQYLFAHGANIMQADQFSTADGAGRFFLRVEFQTDALDVTQEELEARFAARSEEHTSEL